MDRISRARSVVEATTIAREEVSAFMASLRGREAVVTNYLLLVEGKLFECVNNMTWLRDFYRGLDRSNGE